MSTIELMILTKIQLYLMLLLHCMLNAELSLFRFSSLFLPEYSFFIVNFYTLSKKPYKEVSFLDLYCSIYLSFIISLFQISYIYIYIYLNWAKSDNCVMEICAAIFSLLSALPWCFCSVFNLYMMYTFWTQTHDMYRMLINFNAYHS